MKTCILNSSRDASSTPDSGFFSDASRHMPNSRHEFVIACVTEANVNSQIDCLLQCDYDLFINNLLYDDVARAQASTYLASKNVLMIENPTAMLKESKIDLGKATEQCGLRITEDLESHRDDLRCSVIVVEMGHEAVALTPLKSRQVLVEEELRKCEIQDCAVKLFKSLGLEGRVGCARIDLLLGEHHSADHVVNVECPAIFHSGNDTLDDDFVISKTFPGGHAAIFDMLVTTKQIQQGQHLLVADQVAAYFDQVASTYNSALSSSGLLEIQQFMAANFDFAGTVLDVPCGNGPFGNILYERKIPAKITGIEISKGMTESPYIKSFYQQPILIGPMQELLMKSGEFDHIVCFSGLQFLPREQLTAVLARMFMLARKSVTFEADDLNPDYLDMVRKRNGGKLFDFNNVQPVEEFGIPNGWHRVYWDKKYLYTSPSTKTEVFGYLMRYERL